MKTNTMNFKEIRSTIRSGDKCTQPFRVILRIVNGEWVTHVENLTAGLKIKAKRDTYWGHYHGSDFNAAMKDFAERCAKYGLERE